MNSNEELKGLKEIDYEKVKAYLAAADKAGLTVEIVTTALKNIVDLPELYKNDIALAMKNALLEWDCIN